MNKEEISKLVQKEIINGIKKELDSALIFTYIQSIEQENKELYNKIDKAYKIVKDVSYGLNINFDDVLEILKDGEEKI